MNNFVYAPSNEIVSNIKKDYVYYDTGMEEIIIGRVDIAKAIAATPDGIDATIFVLDESFNTHIIATTFGCFINKADQEWLDKNINDVISYQVGNKEIGDIYYMLEDEDLQDVSGEDELNE